MKSYKDDSGEFISSPFNRLPPKRTHADYYKLVTEPIDLTIIQRKVRGDEYKTFEEFQSDVELLVNNAKKYYDCNDKEYIDACALWAVFKKTLAKMDNKESSEDEAESEEEELEESEEEQPPPKPTPKVR